MQLPHPRCFNGATSLVAPTEDVVVVGFFFFFPLLFMLDLFFSKSLSRSQSENSDVALLLYLASACAQLKVMFGHAAPAWW